MESIPQGESQLVWGTCRPDDLVASEQFTPGNNLSLGNFNLEYWMNDTHLEIEAEHQQTFKFHKKKLNNDDINNLTTGLFTHVGDFADFVQLALSGQDPNISLTINDDAKLTLSVKTKIGNKDKNLTFDVQLEEEILSELDLTRKYLQKLPREQVKTLTSYEKQLIKIVEKVVDHNSQLEKELKDTQQKLSEVMERIEALEAKLG